MTENQVPGAPRLLGRVPVSPADSGDVAPVVSHPAPPPVTQALPRLGRGIRWSDIVDEMEREQQARLSRDIQEAA